EQSQSGDPGYSRARGGGLRCRRGHACPHRSRPDQWRPPFFGRFRNLRVDDRRCGVALAPAVFAASLHERLMNTIEHAIARPFPEVIIDRAMWRKILWQLPPLATRAIDIANCVEPLAHACVALASARASRRDHRLDDSPLLVGHITRITFTPRLVRLALFLRPHGSPRLSRIS